MKMTILALLVAVTPHTKATIHRTFKPDDFEILWVSDLSEVVAVSARQRPDLLLLDLNQPLHEGLGTFERLRTANPEVPVVVLSACESIYDMTVANRNGVVLHKPIGVAELQQTVHKLLNLPTAIAPDANDDSILRDASAESEEFRASLHRRATTRLDDIIPYDHWGLNE